MGTRAITHVVDDEGKVYVSLYRQYDGYPKGGHGEDLAKFLGDAVIGNGIRGGESRNFFNGVPDLAVRLVTFFKEDHSEIGGFYMYPPDLTHDEEFTYIIRADSGYDREGSVTIEVKSWGEQMFLGNTEEFTVWIVTSEDY